MPHIREETTLEDVKGDNPETIWYSYRSCWWTHRASDLRTHPSGNGLPCDPRGGVLLMNDASGFLSAAESNPDHYGRHGLRAFMAAHNDNCVISAEDSRNTCLNSWDEYNDWIDFKDLIDQRDVQ